MYVHHLHDAVRRLTEQAEQFAKGLQLPGYDSANGETDLLCGVYEVQRLLDRSFDIPQGPHPSFRRRWDAERWLYRIFEGITLGEPRVRFPDSGEHARRISSPDHVQAFRVILSWLPDPFDGPNGNSRALFEWASHHLGIGPADWEFVDNSDIPTWFPRRWIEAELGDDDDFGWRFRTQDDTREIRRGLLIEAGLLHQDRPRALTVVNEAERQERASAPGIPPLPSVTDSPARPGTEAACDLAPNPKRGRTAHKRETSRDGTKTLKVIGWLNIYLESYDTGETADPLPTVKDIARRLGVSESLVSRVGRKWVNEHRQVIKREMLGRCVDWLDGGPVRRTDRRRGGNRTI
jgi:hypothetical protein